MTGLFIFTTITFALVAAYLGYLYYQQKKTPVASQSQELEKSFQDKINALKKQRDEALNQAKKDLQEGQKDLEKKLRQEVLQEFESKNEVLIEKQRLEMQARIKEEENEMRQSLLERQVSLDKREAVLQEKQDRLEEAREDLQQIRLEIDDIRAKNKTKEQELCQREETLQAELDAKLESIAKLSKQEAKEQIIEQSKEEMGQELLLLQRKALDDAEDRANEEARNIVSMAIQRCSSEVANELTITSIKLSNEDEKGKIIGKGGRNIQWLEKTLGVEFVIDETPEVVTISGFSSIRRNIAKRSLEKLLADGRIHPSSIEEMYEKAKSEIAQEIAKAGKEAVDELGIMDFPAKLVRILGRLKFRTSYGQNMLKHSVEMAKLAGLLARELNEHFPSGSNPIDVDVCVKGALLHDIGKALDEEMEPKGDHVTLGEKICDNFNLDWRIKKCVSSHHSTGGDVQSYLHDEHGFCIEAAIVDACDNISGVRPGARKESLEAYFQRMEALEKIANNVRGVSKSWIMRGARELWVFFDTQKISAAKMHSTTREIAKKIQLEVKYPGEIKIIGLWEGRVIEYAT